MLMTINRFFSLACAILFSALSCLALAAPPKLNPMITQAKVEKVLKEHVSYHTLNQELMRRILTNFLEDLDPIKTYFIKDEIAKYTCASELLIDQCLRDHKQARFDLFEELYLLMITAIKRRNLIEKKIESLPLPVDLAPIDFKDLDWVETQEDLQERLLHLRALQSQTAAKIAWKSPTHLLELIKKRRLARERTIEQASAKGQQTEMLVRFLKAFASALDHHTTYFTPSETKQFLIQIEQRLSGIGAQLRDDIDGLTVARILEGGPALKSGQLRIDDKIVAVDAEPIAGMMIDESVEKIRGPKGTSVVLTILREEKGEKESQKLEITLIRDEIELSETRFKTETVPYGSGVIALLRLFSFYQNGTDSSANDLKREIEQLQSDHDLLGIILDLRNNTGGVLSQAVEVTSLFIQKGIVASVKDHQGHIRHLRNYNGFPLWNGPLIVLTNKATASCAEIVAQSLQDYGRAIIVGDATTWGKGSYQSFTLDMSKGRINPEGEFKITRGLYYTVSGKSPQLTGMSVDIEIPGPLSELKLGELEEKFPLTSDTIAPNFDDHLDDVPLLHRWQMKKLYRNNRQHRIEHYTACLPILKENSAIRLTQNRNYQNFLKEIKKEVFDQDQIESYGQNDLQLEESCQLMKDLIWLTQTQPLPAAV